MSQYYAGGGGGPAPGSAIETVTGNSGGAVGPDGALNINVVGTGSITIAGNAGTNTETVQLTGLTNHNVLVGAGTATITKVAPSATSGVPFISQGAASDPTFGTAVVAGGGTGNTTFTAYSVICAGTTATGSFQNVSGLGTSGQVLTSNGAGALPTWQDAGGGGITQIDGDGGGSATGATVTFSGATLSPGFTNGLNFTAASSDVTLNAPFLALPECDGTNGILFYNDAASSGVNLPFLHNFSGSGSNVSGNTFLGLQTGNLTNTGILNTCIGATSLISLTSAQNNTCVGGASMQALTSGSNNITLGTSNLNSCDTGQGNICIGGTCLGSTTSGSFNIAIGGLAGGSIDATDSSNILIGSFGASGDNNTIRIGTEGTGNGQQDTCFIAGIANATVTGSAVFVDTNGQLGLTSSSAKFKENIEDLSISKVLDLNPVSFTYKGDPSHAQQYGLIAEEVEKIMPELVVYREGKPFSVHYHLLAPLLLAELKTLRKRIETLENKDII